MPMRYITKPADVTLVNPVTKEPLISDGKPAVWTFDQLVHRLMANPLWVENLSAMRAQKSILDALENAQDGILVLAEDDWQKLKEAAETPRTTVDNGVSHGLGLHPTIASQLLPLLMRIIEAPDHR